MYCATLIEQQLTSQFKNYALIAYDSNGNLCLATRFSSQMEMDALQTALGRMLEQLQSVNEDEGKD